VAQGDLWPESIVQLGQIENKTIIGLLEGIEKFLYNKAYKIISVTDSYVAIIKKKNVDGEKIIVLKNGVDIESLLEPTGFQLLGF